MSEYRRPFRPRPVTLFCKNCHKPYDLVTVTENKKGAFHCPNCKVKLGSVT